LAPEISGEEMRELQAEDENLGAIIEWLETDHILSLETLKSHKFAPNHFVSRRDTKI